MINFTSKQGKAEEGRASLLEAAGNLLASGSYAVNKMIPLLGIIKGGSK